MVLGFEKFSCIEALCFALLLLGCTQVKYDNPYDPDGINYDPSAVVGYSSSVLSSSSSVEPSSSSEEGLPSSSSVVPSSSSAPPSSSSVVPSSSSSIPSSSSLGGGYIYEVQTYKTVVIGTQTWMAENLNYNATGSECYGGVDSNCNTYGRLYSWATAMGFESSCNSSTCSSRIQSPHRGICPSGWHIPTIEEWTTLTDYAGGSSTAGAKLKAKSEWNSDGNGTDNYGFSALPGGYYMMNGFSTVGDRGYWWSATELSPVSAPYLIMSYNGNEVGGGNGNFKRWAMMSVRCVRD